MWFRIRLNHVLYFIQHEFKNNTNYYTPLDTHIYKCTTEALH